MRWLRNRTTGNRGWLVVTSTLATAALIMGLAGLSAPAASAYGSGPPGYPTIQVLVTEGPGQVMGWGWGEDTAVTITRTRDSVTTVLGTPGLGSPQPSAFAFSTSNGQLARGDVITVTGNVSDYSRVLEVIDLKVGLFDVADSQLSGTKGSSTNGWGGLRLNTGNMYGSSTTQVQQVADESTTWFAQLDPAYFDMMRGEGVSLWQQDADGDTLQTMQGVPNPTARIEGHGVSGNGWLPGSTVTIFLDDDPGDATPYPYSYTRGVDAYGYFWEGPPDDPQWQVVQPGWIARVVGPYPTRDNGVVTKEVRFAALPIPTVTGNVISGTVPGTLSATTVGAGSLVETAANCPGMGTSPLSRNAFADEVDGAYAVDFGAAVTPPWGWGGPCTEPLFHYGANVKDRDGDEVHFTWFVDSMFDATHPSLSADEPVADDQDFGILGTGWDLTAMRIQQCAMDGDAVGDCDPATTQFVTSYPDEGWPTTMARLDPSVHAKQVLELSGGGTVDCAQAPGTCAVQVTEMYRPEITAFAPLTYEVPYWVELQLQVDPTATVVKASGGVTLTGSVWASDSASVHLYGEVYERLGRKVVSGSFDTWVDVPEPGQTMPWTVTVQSWNGLAYGAGSARVVMTADLGDQGPTDGTGADVVVKLVAPKAPKPPRR